MTDVTPRDLSQRPAWAKDAVFYQIFPDRFARSDRVAKPSNLRSWSGPPSEQGYQGGDLLGVVDHLDYLVELGINAIYLTPIFQSACNHRYHTHDYYEVDPLLGGNDAFRQLLKACHDRGIRVVLDGVFNHASRGFFQFHDLLENGESSPWRDWFYIDAFPLHPYDDDEPANYAAWWGIRALPKFNTDNAEVREYLMRVAEYWAHQGIDGWRLDVPEEIKTQGFWEEFRDRVRAINPDLYIVGEIWADAGDYINDGTRFDATMNYKFTTAAIAFAVGTRVAASTQLDNPWYDISPPIDADGYGYRIQQLLDMYSTEARAVNLNLLGSHDTARILSIASGDTTSVKLATLLLMTFPGTPSIYYGDEIGLDGGTDPGSRKAFPWDESEWDQDLYETTKSLIALRRDHSALRSTVIERVHPPHGQSGPMLSIFARGDASERILVAVNAGEDTELASLPLTEDTDEFELLWGTASVTIGENHARISVPPRSGAVWRVA